MGPTPEPASWWGFATHDRTGYPSHIQERVRLLQRWSNARPTILIVQLPPHGL